MRNLRPFHLAIPVHNLEKARYFYGEILELREGRSYTIWVDFDFFGHQLVIHEDQNSHQNSRVGNIVDGKTVPIPHYGILLGWEEFHSFAEMLLIKNIKFQVEPYIRFEGKVGEQATMFFYDPSGNVLEFKAFKDERQIFAK
jgi:extradiol dioxygenase family protein